MAHQQTPPRGKARPGRLKIQHAPPRLRMTVTPPSKDHPESEDLSGLIFYGQAL